MAEVKSRLWSIMISLITISTLFFGVLFENLSWALVSFFFTIPLWITLFRDTDNFFIHLTSKAKWIGYTVIFVQLLLWFTLTCTYDFLPNHKFYSFSFTIGQFIGIVVLVVLIIKRKNSFKGTSKLFLVYMMCSLTVNNILLFVNYPRAGNEYEVHQKILKKSISNSKGKHYN